MTGSLAQYSLEQQFQLKKILLEPFAHFMISPTAKNFRWATRFTADEYRPDDFADVSEIPDRKNVVKGMLDKLIEDKFIEYKDSLYSITEPGLDFLNSNMLTFHERKWNAAEFEPISPKNERLLKVILLEPFARLKFDRNTKKERWATRFTIGEYGPEELNGVGKSLALKEAARDMLNILIRDKLINFDGFFYEITDKGLEFLNANIAGVN